MNTIYNLIKIPSVNVILGKRGSGKSALAHSLLENLSIRYNLNAGIVGFPEDKKYLIPNTYKVFNCLDFPKNCIIFIDEVSFFAHARKSMSTINIALDNIMSRCRHMNWIIIIASHHSTKIDISIIRDSDNIIFKEPSRLEVEYGSRTGVLSSMSKKAKDAFEHILCDRRRYSYIFNEDSDLMVLNNLAKHWSDELSITTVLSIDSNNDNNKKTRSNNSEEDYDEYMNNRRREAIITQGDNLFCCICKNKTNMLYSSVCSRCFDLWMLDRKDNI